jgi:hypothetical protein
LICPFCKARPATLLCDGRLEDGRTCNAGICRACAHCVTHFHFRLARKQNGSRCRNDTVDLCPQCKALDRKQNWGGMSRAAREMAPPPSPQIKFEF